MMRALEYVYLLGAVAAATAYVLLQSQMSSAWILLVSTVVFAFMFSFRRKQRIQIEEFERNHPETPEAEPTEEDGNV